MSKSIDFTGKIQKVVTFECTIECTSFAMMAITGVGFKTYEKNFARFD